MKLILSQHSFFWGWVGERSAERLKYFDRSSYFALDLLSVVLNICSILQLLQLSKEILQLFGCCVALLLGAPVSHWAVCSKSFRAWCFVDVKCQQLLVHQVHVLLWRKQTSSITNTLPLGRTSLSQEMRTLGFQLQNGKEKGSREKNLQTDHIFAQGLLKQDVLYLLDLRLNSFLFFLFKAL